MQKRHEIDISKLGNETFLLNRVERSLSKIDGNPDLKLSVLIDKLKNLLLLSVLENQPIKKVRKYAELLTKFSLINWQRNFQAVEFTYEGKHYKLNKLEKRSMTTSNEIFKILNLAIISNEDEKIDQLLGLNLNKDENPYSISKLEFLKGLLKEDTSILETEHSKIQEYTQNGTTIYHGLEGSKIIHSNDLAVFYQTLSTPIIDLYQLAYHKDSKRFNEVIENYALSKRNYLGKFKKLHEWEHWVDFDAVAVCAYAQRRDIAVNFKSEYIPMWIVDMG